MLRIDETTPFKVELDSTRVESLLRNLLKYWFTLRHFAMDDPTGKAMQFTQKCFDQYYFIFVNIPQFNWKKIQSKITRG